MRRWMYLFCGCLSLLLGVIGAFLPILPTTPFVLLASYCFCRSSERLHIWLLAHKRLGPMISDWEEHGVIRASAKRTATLLILLSFSYAIFIKALPVEIDVFLIVTAVCVLAFIWTRPSVESVEQVLREAS